MQASKERERTETYRGINKEANKLLTNKQTKESDFLHSLAFDDSLLVIIRGENSRKTNLLMNYHRQRTLRRSAMIKTRLEFAKLSA